jgi:hypothetical protein
MPRQLWCLSLDFSSLVFGSFAEFAPETDLLALLDGRIDEDSYVFAETLPYKDDCNQL